MKPYLRTTRCVPGVAREIPPPSVLFIKRILKNTQEEKIISSVAGRRIRFPIFLWVSCRYQYNKTTKVIICQFVLKIKRDPTTRFAWGMAVSKGEPSTAYLDLLSSNLWIYIYKHKKNIYIWKKNSIKSGAAIYQKTFLKLLWVNRFKSF